MEPLRQLRADDLAEVLTAAATSMEAHATGLDRLDRLDQLDGIDGGDTGRHLAAMLSAVATEVRSGATLTELADAIERGIGAGSSAGSATGATVGRSGRLIGAFLSGIAELCRNADALDPTRLAMGFEAGHAAMVAAIEGAPRPGSMVDVAEVIAEVALRLADDGVWLADQMIEVAERGLDALEATPAAFEPLADAGVVDAGAAGLLVLIDTFVAVIHGDDPELPDWEFPEAADDDGEAWASERFRYEVSLRLDGDPGAGVRLERAWTTIGDEVRAVPEGDGVRATVRTDDIGAAIEAAVSLGRPSGIVVRDCRG